MIDTAPVRSRAAFARTELASRPRRVRLCQGSGSLLGRLGRSLYHRRMRSVVAPSLSTLLRASGAIAQPRAEQVDPFAVAAAGLGRVI